MTLSFNETDFLFSTPDYTSNQLRVLSFSGREEISRPFEFEIELVSDLDDIDPAQLIGQPAQLTLRGPTGDRQVHGILERFDQIRCGRRFTHYAAVLVPALAPLEFTRRSRIFQRLPVPDIVSQVLTRAGFSGDLLQPLLNEEHGARDFCVQYQESDHAFVSRLLEEEGIFYYYDHREEEAVLVIGDHPDATGPLPHGATINFRDESRASVLEEACIFKFLSGAAMRPGRASMRDYTFKKPQLDMETTFSADEREELELYYYPGEYVDPDVGSQLARARLEEAQVARHRFTGVGTSRALMPGHRFTLALHPRSTNNREYLLLSVEHQGTQPGVLEEEHGAGQVTETTYQSRFVCIPATLPFRPARTTPRPIIPGIQPARVVGPSGEEIYCDQFGRVKVQFYWDREGRFNDQSSCWVRVNQPWAGVAYGGMFLPRVGQEVLVQFLEGDPDRPVIMGRTYNGDNPVPYPLPDNKTRSTFKSSSSPGGSGFNEFRFEDRAGSEEVFLHAQKDFNEVVLNNHTTTVNANQTNTVKGNQTESVDGNQSMTVGGNRTKTVQGTETNTVVKDRTTTVQKNDTNSVTLDRSHSIGQNETLTVGVNRTTAITADDTLTTKNRTKTVHETEANTIKNRSTTVKEIDFLTVKGDRVTVVEGAQANKVKGDATMVSETGAVAVVAQTGTLTVGAKGALTVVSDTDTVTVQGGQKVVVSAPEIAITATTKVSIGVGNSTITIDASGVKISGPMISSSAVGIHTISGALIKIN